MPIDTTIGGPASNSYVSVADADAYFAATYEDWADLTEAEKEAALIKACIELEIKYRGKWIGQKATSTQRLAWPRASKVDDPNTTLVDADGVPIPVDAIPGAVQQAQCEVAKIALTGGTFMTQPVTKDQFIKRKKVDVLETEWDTGKAPSQPQYPLIDQILFGLASSAAGGTPTVNFNLGLTQTEINQGSDSSDVLSDPRYFIQG
ncbi:MAG TPA: DnaT-like ssDNA-binding protein [Rhizobacter sp.]